LEKLQTGPYLDVLSISTVLEKLHLGNLQDIKRFLLVSLLYALALRVLSHVLRLLLHCALSLWYGIL
jgi:hypothetical protein